MNPFADLVPTQKQNSASNLGGNPFADLTPGYQAPAVSSTPTETPEKNGSKVGNLFKGIVSAPATILARPAQAIQATGQYIQDRPKIKEYERAVNEITVDNERLTQELRNARAQGLDTTAIVDRIKMNNTRLTSLNSAISPTLDRKPTLFQGSDIVAPIPENMADVKKDVGRAIQTVALGTGASIAGGAAFGLGASLEEGNDLFSVDTLINTALGGAGGKALDWVGKPLLNAAGKVVGTITPQVLKDVAAKGAGALQKFAEENQLLGGIAKPLSEKISTGFQAVDDKANSLFKGANVKGKIKDVISEQYPGLSKEARTNHFLEVNRKNILQPTTEASPAYAKASRIAKDAERRGINLGEVIDDTRTFDHQIKDKKIYSTLDHADELENQTKSFGSVIREAFKEAEPGVQRVAVSDIRNAMLKKIDDIPPSQVTPEERVMMRKQIEKRYGDNSAAAREYPNGYSLTDLYDNRIISQTRGKYREGGIMSDAVNAERSRYEGQVFNEIMDAIVPEEMGLQAVRREMEKRFVLADYLRSLNGKKVPTTIVGKAANLFGRAVGGIAGSKFAGGYGALLGSRFGDVFFDFLENAPNPVRKKILESLNKESPVAYKQLIEYIKKSGKERLMRVALPSPGTSSFKEPTKPIFVSPKGKAGENFQEVVDITATEGRNVKAPKNTQTKAQLRKIREFIESNRPYASEAEMPVIKSPKRTPKRLNDVYKDLPTINF